MSDVTRLIQAVQKGDRHAAAELLPLVYDELRKLAAVKMAGEDPGHTLNATALVHEAYLRLVRDQHFEGRGRFFAAAAEAMRRILVDSARRKQALVRGSGRKRVALDPGQLVAPAAEADLWIDVDEVLSAFEAVDSTAANLAKLRIFGGLSVDEAGEAIGLPRATAFRVWSYARAWLTAALADRSKDS
jgi:RNA polymerase sigma factor (TIGR02999 family)